MKQSLTMAMIMLVCAAVVLSATPTMINYQGRLTNSTGGAVPDSSYTVVFTIYNAESGGNMIWTETQAVTTSDGSFAVLLGWTTPISDTVFAATARYLGVKVGTDPE